MISKIWHMVVIGVSTVCSQRLHLFSADRYTLILVYIPILFSLITTKYCKTNPVFPYKCESFDWKTRTTLNTVQCNRPAMAKKRLEAVVNIIPLFGDNHQGIGFALWGRIWGIGQKWRPASILHLADLGKNVVYCRLVIKAEGWDNILGKICADCSKAVGWGRDNNLGKV